MCMANQVISILIGVKHTLRLIVVRHLNFNPSTFWMLRGANCENNCSVFLNHIQSCIVFVSCNGIIHIKQICKSGCSMSQAVELGILCLSQFKIRFRNEQSCAPELRFYEFNPHETGTSFLPVTYSKIRDFLYSSSVASCASLSAITASAFESTESMCFTMAFCSSSGGTG